jgi:transglutaminase-like putative cysteine protease
MLLTLAHRTRSTYTHTVALSHQILRLTPRSYERQRVISHRLEVDPEPDRMETRTDAFGNAVTEILIQTDHSELVIDSHAVVDVLDGAPIMLDLSTPWEHVAAAIDNPPGAAALEAAQFAFPSPDVDTRGAAAFAADLFAPGTPVLRVAAELSHRIHEEFEYQGGVTDVYTPVRRILRARRGVCQDFAHVAIARLRAAGLAVRYVSGYLLTNRSADGSPLPTGAPVLTGADASHAWISVWCPEFGWVAFDPTNDMMPSTSHVTLGWGRDYSDVSPTRGFLHGGGAHTIDVAVEVTRSNFANAGRT